MLLHSITWTYFASKSISKFRQLIFHKLLHFHNNCRQIVPGFIWPHTMPETRREPLTRSGWPLRRVRERARLFVCVCISSLEKARLSLSCPFSPINRPADRIIMLQFSNLFSAFNFSLVSASYIKRAHYQKLSAKSSHELHHPFGLWQRRRFWPQDIAV